MAHLQRPSKRAPVPQILESFPAPPSHIPLPPLNPPPTGPPSAPLPPLPSSPSPISEQDQLFILSSVANRTRRSSRYSQRDSSSNASSPSRDSMLSSRSASSMGPISRSNSLTTPTCPSPLQQFTIPGSLSDISDSDTEAAKTTTILNSPPLLRRPHQHNDSITSIDISDVLGVYPDAVNEDHQRSRLQSTARYIQRTSVGHPIDPQVDFQNSISASPPPAILPAPSLSPSLSPSRRSPTYSHSPHRSSLGSYKSGSSHSQSLIQTPIQTHTRSLSNSTKTGSLSRGTSQWGAQGVEQEARTHREEEREPADLPISQSPLHDIVVTKATTTTTPTIHSNAPQGPTRSRRRGSDVMTLDELGTQPLTSTQSQRVPSPDIPTILSIMPRPALSLSRSHSGLSADAKARSKSKSGVSMQQRRVVSASTINIGGVACHRQGSSHLSIRSNSLPAENDADYEALERVLEGQGSDDEYDAMSMDMDVWNGAVGRGRRSTGNIVQEDIVEERGSGSDSDSSLDLHTPLPHLMLRHGLLSPNSKLLPQANCSRAATPSDGRPGSIMSLVTNGSAMTKSGLIRDERDTLTRRVRHRDGKLLRGGIGLTTGLGWSDSEDEDAPSPLTRRLSSLNLSRRSSAASLRSATSIYTSPPSQSWTGKNHQGNTPSSTSSAPSIPMPSTPQDIFDPTSPPLLSSTRGMWLVNRDKSLPPLPAGVLKKKASGSLQRSIISNSTGISSTTTMAATPTLNAIGKYAFPRARTFSSTSTASTSIPSPSANTTSPTINVVSSSMMSSSPSSATIKPNVRPLQLPRQTISIAGDRPAVPVPSPIFNSSSLPPATSPSVNTSSFRASAPSLSPPPTHHPSPILSGHVGTLPATGIARPKPRTGTGMVYRTSSYGVGGSSKIRTPIILSRPSSLVSGVSVTAGEGSGGASGPIQVGRSSGVPRAIAL